MSDTPLGMNYAGFWKRAGAYLIDSIPLTLIVVGAAYYFFEFDVALKRYMENNSDLAERARFYQSRNMLRETIFGVWILYSAVFDASPLQGTFGKRLVGIRVVDSQGNRIGILKSLARNMTKIISYLALFLGFIWIAFSRRKQGWHDSVSKCYVIVEK